jgi:hypothetical protein
MFDAEFKRGDRGGTRSIECLISAIFALLSLKILAACDETQFAQTILQEFAESAEKWAEIPPRLPRPPVNGLSDWVAAEPRWAQRWKFRGQN